jgi:hypothetical protein
MVGWVERSETHHLRKRQLMGIASLHPSYAAMIGERVIPMQVATIPFTDRDSGDEAMALVRVEGEIIGLALSLRQNGDIEVLFGRQELEQLIEALQKAQAALPGVKPVA